jgi:hypothetical protein
MGISDADLAALGGERFEWAETWIGMAASVIAATAATIVNGRKLRCHYSHGQRIREAALQGLHYCRAVI